MTVPYNRSYSSVTALSLVKILFRWRGSIWKAIWMELLVWMMFYYALYGLLTWLGKSQGEHPSEYLQVFKQICKYCSSCLTPTALVMLLSFFVTKAFDRWHGILQSLGHIESPALTINGMVIGTEQETRLGRRTLVRYLCLAQVLVYRDISQSVRIRFPTLESIRDAGYLTDDECHMLGKEKLAYENFVIPIVWAQNLILSLKLKGQITSEPAYTNILMEVRNFRTKLETVFNYDCTPVPMAYPQIVSIATRGYFLMTVLANLYWDHGEKEKLQMLLPNPYFFFGQGFFFMLFLGWVKIGETLLDPLGEDDDDLELNHVIDRNIAVGMSIVDNFGICPPIEADTFDMHGPMYPEDATDLGGDHHRLRGSVVHMKFDDPKRMVEVSSSKAAPRASIRRRKSVMQKVQKFGGIVSRTVSVSDAENGKGGPPSTESTSVESASPEKTDSPLPSRTRKVSGSSILRPTTRSTRDSYTKF